MLLVIMMAVSTLLVVFLMMGIKKVDKSEIAEIVIAKAYSNKFAKENEEDKKANFLKKNEKFHTVSEKKVVRKVKQWDKQIDSFEELYRKYITGKKLTKMDVLTMFGYFLLDQIGLDAHNETFRKLISSCEYSGYMELERNQETSGKRNSVIYATYIMASLVAYMYVGVAAALIGATVTIAMGNELTSILMVSVVAFGIFAVLGYLPYDEITNKAKKRKDAIEMDFPNAISQIALLVMAGLNVTNAIRQTAEGGDGPMYRELQKTMKQIDQSVSVGEAFSRLQCRCNNKYLDKMVTIITKSYVSGNANLADDLKQINDECWLEKKHNARRMGETIQTKLFVPTMLMFVGILVVIIVPAMSGFNF